MEIKRSRRLKESKDLTSLSLDELIGNLKSVQLPVAKTRVRHGGKETSQKFFKRRVDSWRTNLGTTKDVPKKPPDDKNVNSDRKTLDVYPNHLIGECPKPPKDKNPRAFAGGSWSDSGE
ncbi:hypothetical protein Tco_0313845 [Tanacetum coccineum]